MRCARCNSIARGDTYLADLISTTLSFSIGAGLQPLHKADTFLIARSRKWLFQQGMGQN
jgi:hypothetical protein